MGAESSMIVKPGSTDDHQQYPQQQQQQQQLCQEPVLRPRIEVADTSCAQLLRPSSSYSSLVDPVRRLFLRSLRGETFDDFAAKSFLRKDRARDVDWRIWVIFERKGPEKEEELGLIGFLIASMGYPREKPVPLRIERLAVLEECRGLGYGERLTAATFDWARQLPKGKCSKVCLDAFDEAVGGVVPFYERLGFTVKEEDEDDDDEE